MKIFFILVSLLTILCSRALAQDPEVFEQIYLKTYLETSHTDFNKALKTADSLFEHVEGATFKVRSLMLSATLYQQTGDLSNAVVFAEKAQKLARQTDDYNWQARVAGFLASQYRGLRLYQKSNKYSLEAMDVARKISNPERANSTIGFMYQEQAFCAFEEKKYRKTIADVNNAQNYFNNASKKDIDLLTANNEQLIGDAYAGLKLYDSALLHYNKGLKHLEKLPENYVGGLIMKGMSEVYMELEDMQAARQWLDSAQGIADRSHYQQLKLVVYETVKKYAAMVADIEQLSQAQKMQDTARTTMTIRSDSFLDRTFSDLEKNYLNEVKQGSYKNVFILAALVLIAGSVIFIIITRRQQKARFEAVLTRMNEREEQRKLQEPAALPAEVSASPEQLPEVPISVPEEVLAPGIGLASGGEQSRELTAIPEETMRKILNHLQEFEAGTLFTNRNISLSYLAGHINTNTKYLSRAINLHKQKDFNGYINELRINYIIECLRKDAVWRKYKISTLADEAGFSSHSKFAAIFKSVTGISPSVFIQYLEEESLSGKE
ncbi:MAG: helix-turn-helix domain-containing protein [Taibaiella sp.]|nr:helix-turn-helix domain-containing protein [Taibaiella sp.]